MTRWERYIGAQKLVEALNKLTHEMKVVAGTSGTLDLINMALVSGRLPKVAYSFQLNSFSADLQGWETAFVGRQEMPHEYEEWYDVVSTSASKLRHITASNLLYIQFPKGAVYRYQGVPVDVFEKVLYSPSVGQAIDALIKKHRDPTSGTGYPYAVVDPSEYLAIGL